MTITTEHVRSANRVRAGAAPTPCAFKQCTRPAGPCAGNCTIQTRRVEASMLPHATEFAGPEPVEPAQVETVEQYTKDAMEITWVGYLLMAALLTFCSMGIGYMAGRYFS